jgi:hypothetical protein
VFDLFKHQSLALRALIFSKTYAGRPPAIRDIVDLMASVARLEVPSNELMVVINGRRRVFPNVDAPWLLGSMTLLVDFVLE